LTQDLQLPFYRKTLPTTLSNLFRDT